MQLEVGIFFIIKMSLCMFRIFILRKKKISSISAWLYEILFLGWNVSTMVFFWGEVVRENHPGQQVYLLEEPIHEHLSTLLCHTASYSGGICSHLWLVVFPVPSWIFSRSILIFSVSILQSIFSLNSLATGNTHYTR